MSKRSNLAELMFLFKIGLSRLISKLYLISSTNLLFQFTKMVNSSNDGILLQFKRWSPIALSFDGLVFLNVKGDIPICSPDLTFKCLFFYHIYHTYIYILLQTPNRKARDLWNGKHLRVFFGFWKQFEGYGNSVNLWKISLTSF